MRAGQKKTEPERWAGLRSWRWSLDRRGGAWAHGLVLSSEAGPKALRRTRPERGGVVKCAAMGGAGAKLRHCRRGPARGQNGVWIKPPRDFLKDWSPGRPGLVLQANSRFCKVHAKFQPFSAAQMMSTNQPRVTKVGTHRPSGQAPAPVSGRG